MKYRVLNRLSANGYQIQLDAVNYEQRVQIGTGIYVENKNYFVDGRLTAQAMNYKLKNIRLAEIENQVDRLCLGYVLDFNEEVRKIVKGIGYERKKKGNLFVDYLDEYIQTKEKPTTKVCYEQTKKKILIFDKGVTTESLDYDWVVRFDKWLTAKGMSINGKSIILRNVRTIVNYCITKEVMRNYPFRRFKIKKEQTRKRNLTASQLMELRYYPCESFHEEYRDMFMLMFYLIGINAVDLFQMKPSNIINGRLEYVRRKTDKDNASERRIISIKLEPEAMDIINRYKGKKLLLSCCERYSDYHDYLHHMNDALKRIGMTYKVGLKAQGEPLFPDLTSYWARHSWASIAAELDVPVNTIAHALGHAQTSVTDTYINFDRRKVDRANRDVIDYITKSEGDCLFVAI